jgi:Family of unknown function (DUF5317)
VFLAFVAVVLVASVPLIGGKLSRLADLRFRGVPLLAGALAVQILVISVWRSPDPAVAATLHVLTYALAAAFLWWNRRIAGVPLVALGAALNGVTIAVNGGTLPASRTAVSESGFRVAADHFANSDPLAHPRLSFLGDIFVTPSWLPFRNVFSVGDIVIVLGAAVCLHVVCGSRVAAAARHLAERMPASVTTPRTWRKASSSSSS